MNGHNPDILTCLANLSADEVFTPPKLASAMLDILPTDLFRRPDTTFLDPFCKSGVFLREIAQRLNEGLKDQMPDGHRRPRQQVRSLRKLRRLDSSLSSTQSVSIEPCWRIERASVYDRSASSEIGLDTRLSN